MSLLVEQGLAAHQELPGNTRYAGALERAEPRARAESRDLPFCPHD
jgi:hypothetical protein